MNYKSDLSFRRSSLYYSLSPQRHHQQTAGFKSRSQRDSYIRPSLIILRTPKDTSDSVSYSQQQWWLLPDLRYYQPLQPRIDRYLLSGSLCKALNIFFYLETGSKLSSTDRYQISFDIQRCFLTTFAITTLILGLDL